MHHLTFYGHRKHCLLISMDWSGTLTMALHQQVEYDRPASMKSETRMTHFLIWITDWLFNYLPHLTLHVIFTTALDLLAFLSFYWPLYLFCILHKYAVCEVLFCKFYCVIFHCQCQTKPGSSWCSLILLSPSSSPEKLAQAKEENLDMHQTLDQTLLELNNL